MEGKQRIYIENLYRYFSDEGDQWEIFLQNHPWHTLQAALVLTKTDQKLLHGSVSNWRRLIVGIFSCILKTSGDQGG